MGRTTQHQHGVLSRHDEQDQLQGQSLGRIVLNPLMHNVAKMVGPIVE